MFGQSLLSAFGSAACTTDTDQLFTTDVQTTSVATYQLNNATTSIPSNTYPGTASNITYAAGKFGNAAVFNGSNASITTTINKTDIVNINDKTKDFSISLWLKPHTTPSGTKNIFVINAGAPSYQYSGLVATSSGLIAFSHYPGGASGNAAVASATLNVWSHYVAIRENSKMKIYKNSIFIQETAITTSNTTLTSETWNFGSRTALNDNFYDGEIDQVRIFPSALPQAAVTALYNETTTTATYPYVTTEVANPNSVAYYKMSNATDQLGNYNGTATDVNFNTEGKFGFAGAFNGSSSNFTFTGLKTNGSPLTVTSFSVSMWVNFNSFSSPQNLISNLNGLNYEIGWTLNADTNGKIGILTDNNTSASWLMYKIYEQALSINTWYNLVFVSDGTNNRLYINGNESSTVTYPIGSQVALNANASDLEIGFGGSSRIPNGSIDQIRIYDSAISAENVTTLYNEIECPAVAVTNAFNTVLYTGNGSTQPISTVGFQPDLVFLHWRNTGNARNPIIFDSVRGVTKYLKTNTNEVQATLSTTLTSFNINGFSIGSSAAVNENNSNWVAWNWKAGGNSNTFNIDGTGYSTASAAGLDGGNINPTGASINKASGFGIYTASPTTASQSISHGLDSAPEMYIFKTTNVTRDWYVSVNVGGTWKFGTLNTTAALSTTTAYTANSNTMVIGGGSSVNEVVYAFTSVPGYSRIGSYVGNGSATGPVVYLGFEPAFVMIKKTDATGAWSMFDNKRDPSNPVQKVLQAQSNAAEANVGNACNFNSNNFQLTDTNSQRNANGGTYIFIAIA